jgi:hypothetical protein
MLDNYIFEGYNDALSKNLSKNLKATQQIFIMNVADNLQL